MPFQVRWYTEKRIMLIHLEGAVSIDDLPLIMKSVRQYIAVGEAPVHVLVDLRTVTHYPTNLRAIQNAVGVRSNDKLGWSVLITENTVTRFISTMLAQLGRLRVHVAPALDAALRFVQERDETLKRSESA